MVDKSPSMYGQPASVDANGTPDHSPTANEDSVEGAEGDDDDPFSKRRYYCTKLALDFFNQFMMTF